MAERKKNQARTARVKSYEDAAPQFTNAYAGDGRFFIASGMRGSADVRERRRGRRVLGLAPGVSSSNDALASLRFRVSKASINHP